MLKKGFCLRKKEDFERVFRFGKTLFFEGIGCRYKKDTPSFHIGFSLSKKYLPLAVDRNRLRRRLSEAVYSYKEKWPKEGDVVFFLTQKQSKERPFIEIKKRIEDLFQILNK
ncbi:MAG: ribonuclease P protein component [Candidatus Moranbacteria bacterium]|nr:ribonuclease P protein component [Candidatus Moranbacteria bacterium]MDD3964617.1 ribonuclease P protein component [Candidatus Moranbacteria bacterium]